MYYYKRQVWTLTLVHPFGARAVLHVVGPSRRGRVCRERWHRAPTRVDEGCERALRVELSLLTRTTHPRRLCPCRHGRLSHRCGWHLPQLVLSDQFVSSERMGFVTRGSEHLAQLAITHQVVISERMGSVRSEHRAKLHSLESRRRTTTRRRRRRRPSHPLLPLPPLMRDTMLYTPLYQPLHLSRYFWRALAYRRVWRARHLSARLRDLPLGERAPVRAPVTGASTTRARRSPPHAHAPRPV